jgi:hypothetical protein
VSTLHAGRGGGVKVKMGSKPSVAGRDMNMGPSGYEPKGLSSILLVFQVE